MKFQSRQIENFIRIKKSQKQQSQRFAQCYFTNFGSLAQTKKYFSKIKQASFLQKNTRMDTILTEVFKDCKQFEVQLKRLQKKQIIHYFFQLSFVHIQKSILYQVLKQIIKLTKEKNGSIFILQEYCQIKMKLFNLQDQTLLKQYMKWVIEKNGSTKSKSQFSNISSRTLSSKNEKISEKEDQSLQDQFQKLNGPLKRFESDNRVFERDHIKKQNTGAINQKAIIIQQISKLKQQNQQAKIIILQLQKQLKNHGQLFNHKSSQLVKLQSEFHQIQQQSKSTTKQLQQYKNKNQKQKKILAQADQTILQLKNKLQRIQSDKKRTQQQDIGKSLLIQQVKKQNKQLNIRHEKAQHEIVTQKQISKKLHNFIDELKSSHEMERCNMLQNKKFLQRQIEQVNKLLLEQTKQNIQTNEENKSLTEQIVKLNKENLNLKQNIADQRIKYLLESSKILTFNNIKEKRFLIQNLEELYSRIKRFQLIFRLNSEIKTNFHQYIDNKPNFLVLIQLANGVIIGGYSNEPLTKGQKCYDGIIFSITDLQIYPLKTKYALTYDQYFLIFGNSQIRIRIFQDILFSNFGILNAHFDNKGKKIQNFIKYEKQRQILIKNFQIYQVDYSN